MNLDRRGFLAALGAAALPALAQQRKPNIIFILADDLGYGDLGCYGQRRLQTPHIDKLAAEGMRFTDVYAGSTVCAPSRSCLITGQHTGHTRVRGNASPNGRIPLRSDDISVAELLRSGGYRTGIFGKWGVGEAGTQGTPNKKGFDEWFGYLNQGHAHDFYTRHLWENESEVFLRGNAGGLRTQYSHDVIFDRSLEWLDSAAGAADPFFLYLPWTIPHANNEAGRVTGDGMEVPDYAPYEQEQWPTTEKGFAAMVTRMDRDVGRVMSALKEKGIDENTLVIFSSDNGPHREGGHDPEFFGSRGGLRGIKRDFYEGGIRVPTIARWPGKIEAGAVSSQIWAFWDFLPTACEAAGLEPPDGIDGISMLPALTGKPQRDHEYLYWEISMRTGWMQAVRMGQWKGVRLARDKPIELYNLAQDRAEERDVAREHPDVVRRIAAAFEAAHEESADFPSSARS